MNRKEMEELRNGRIQKWKNEIMNVELKMK
jgi:hypothetical protein